jgi:uncharacterized surface protein with fasciclin (FAS1) repeats
MKKTFQFLTATLFAVGLLLGLTGCQKEKELYQKPPWLGGTNIETLKERGNYTIFLKLMDQANYTIPITKQLFTLFVPDDAAFTAYLQERGVNSIEDLSEDESVELFTLHVLRNPRSRFQLIYEWAWSELQGPNGEYASLFMRKETNSTSIPYSEYVKYSPANQLGKTVQVYTGYKNVPLFSTDWIEDFGGAPDGSDYTFMYPGSTWGNNLNWHSACVIDDPRAPGEKEVRTASGFIFFLDRVVAPMPNMDQYLKAHPEKFGVFYDLMQRFANYTAPVTNEKNEQEYKKSYNEVTDIAEERGPSTNTAVPPQEMFTGFIPTNDVMQAYLDEFIPLYYPHVDSVPKVTLFYILQTQLSKSLGLISKIEKGYFNSFGDAMVVNRSDINSAYMCSNGVVYETNRVLEPNVFTCVPGTLFFNSNYSTLLYALQETNLLTALSNPESDVTLFAPTNEMMEAYNIRYDKDKLQMQFRGTDGIWISFTRTADLIAIMQDHIYKGKLSDLSGEGYLEMSSGNFVHYNNGVITGAENATVPDDVEILETLENDRNGILYQVDNAIKSNYILGKHIATDPDLSKFSELMLATKLIEKKPDSFTKEVLWVVSFLPQSKYWTAFLPTNAAMADAELNGLIPPMDTATDGSIKKDQSKNIALKDFLLYHFVRNAAIFDDGVESGVFSSNRSYTDPNDGVVYTPMTISNSLNNLTITDNSGQVVNVDHATANTLVKKGVAHKINSVLKYQ